MKQPKIKIFGEVHKVRVIEFDKDGFVNKIVYEIGEYANRSVFRGDKVINANLTSERKIQEPTKHPYSDYAFAPNLEDLIVTA